MFCGKEPFFYINTDAENNNIYNSSNGIAESAECRDGYYYPKDGKTSIRINYEEYADTTAVRQTTTVRNICDKPVTVDTLSAAFVCGIGDGGKKFWNEDRFIIHYAFSAWQGEAQWRRESIEQAGLYKTYNHHSQPSIRLGDVGTWSTSKYEPVLFLEDKETGKTWFFAVETGCGWYIDVCARGYRDDSSLCVFISGSYEKNDGWFVTLAPGESYTTCPAVTGCIDGGFDEAVAELTKYRRHTYKTKLPGGVPPLCFNDYMNCLWALPTRDKLIPLINVAAEVGAEYFVIDAGWFGTSGDWNTDMGDWSINDSLFGDGGFAGIVSYINQKGMRAGTWLEIESAGINSGIAKIPGALLTRHGKPIGNPRCFLNFRNPEVRAYIKNAFNRLYDIGFRYIKNDYNQSVGISIDTDNGTSGVSVLYENYLAVMSLVDEVRAAHPDMIIENCGSGAMRSDNATLSHFYLQSTSDQEDYLRVPSIVAGISACIPPERCGIWSYPYPVKIDYRESFVPSAEFTSRFADGRETAFNMVSGMMGLMYLSGHIDCADEYNIELMKSAADIYKKNRVFIAESVPVYPGGTFNLSAEGIYSYGLLDKAAGKLLLAVWNTGKNPGSINIDLSAYSSHPSVALTYPSFPDTLCGAEGMTVGIDFGQGRSAVYLEIDI